MKSESGSTYRNSTGSYQYHILALIVKVTQFTHQHFQFTQVQFIGFFVDQRGRTYLYHNTLFVF